MPWGSKVREGFLQGLGSWVEKIPWRRAWQPLQYSRLENPMDRGAWWGYSP